MLIIYDQNGTIVTKDSKKEDIVGNLNYLDVEVPKDKILNRVDVKVTPHAPIFVDIPKSTLEQLKDRVIALQMFMSQKDLQHDTAIADLTYKLDKLDSFVKTNIKEVK